MIVNNDPGQITRNPHEEDQKMKRLFAIRYILLISALIMFTACSSDLIVAEKLDDIKDGDKKLGGIPFSVPALRKVRTTTTYKPGGSEEDQDYKADCNISKVEESYQTFPLGKTYFASFDSASLGKSEFSIQFTETGLLKSVTLNSDPNTAQNIEATAKLIGSLTGVATEAAKIATGAATKAFVVAGEKPSAEKRREKHCVKDSETVEIFPVTETR